MKLLSFALLLVLLPTAALAQNTGSPVVPTPKSAPNAYQSATVTNTSATILASSYRRFLDIHNASATDTIACSFGGTAAINGGGSVTIPPGYQYSWDGNFVPSDAINCISSAASTAITLGVY